jgi:hypothetical protein
VEVLALNERSQFAHIALISFEEQDGIHGYALYPRPNQYIEAWIDRDLPDEEVIGRYASEADARELQAKLEHVVRALEAEGEI